MTKTITYLTFDQDFNEVEITISLTTPKPLTSQGVQEFTNNYFKN